MKPAIELDTYRTAVLPRNQQDPGRKLTGFDLAEIDIPVERLAQYIDVAEFLVQKDSLRILCDVGRSHFQKDEKWISKKSSISYFLLYRQTLRHATIK